MSEQSTGSPPGSNPGGTPGNQPGEQGEAIVWSLIGTLLAGPALYGLLGFGVDKLFDVAVGLPIGIVVGFVLSFYIIYQRYGRD